MRLACDKAHFVGFYEFIESCGIMILIIRVTLNVYQLPLTLHPIIRHLFLLFYG